MIKQFLSFDYLADEFVVPTHSWAGDRLDWPERAWLSSLTRSIFQANYTFEGTICGTPRSGRLLFDKFYLINHDCHLQLFINFCLLRSSAPRSRTESFSMKRRLICHCNLSRNLSSWISSHRLVSLAGRTYRRLAELWIPSDRSLSAKGASTCTFQFGGIKQQHQLVAGKTEIKL